LEKGIILQVLTLALHVVEQELNSGETCVLELLKTFVDLEMNFKLLFRGHVFVGALNVGVVCLDEVKLVLPRVKLFVVIGFQIVGILVL